MTTFSCNWSTFFININNFIQRLKAIGIVASIFLHFAMLRVQLPDIDAPAKMSQPGHSINTV